ncbi:tRNA dimethylallyltransferase, mitochondrial-like isoform X2 [Acanthaster planci]|uniref:tRNA dimethylallyltransferase, mitochondrial-like isoform X2 n=1 Tax=Acanthaster planci TaxID=133434 RepID=A0A8B7YID4_ACAPL|nr:tRNA dimethylallyltransferase, mitochondrial-like isoform X2 [Acanthaster planci]
MAAPMSTVLRRLPVVVILGATGTGKSKLAIQIGERFGGEIISADSMQSIESVHRSRFPQQGSPNHRRSTDCGKSTGDRWWNQLLHRGSAVESVVGCRETRGDPLNLHIKKKVKHSHADLATNKGQNLSPTLSSSKIASDAEKSLSLVDSEALVQSEPPASENRPALRSSGLPEGKPDLIPDIGLEKTDGRLLTEEKRPGRLAEKVHCDQRDTSHLQSVDQTGRESEISQPKKSLYVDNTTEVSAKGSCRLQHEEVLEQEELMTIDVEGTATEDLYKILAEVDPHRAETLHPNNRRKIIRSLQVYEQLGQTHSEMLSGQMEEEGGGPLGGPLRFQDVCILWLQCDRDALDQRLDVRVDDMLSRGLLDELSDFHREYNRQRVETQADSESLYTQGIFQSIGFKEFHSYLILPEQQRETEMAKNLLGEGIEKLKMATRQYARRQIRWIKNRFVRRPGSNVPAVYAVDSTDPASWDEKVLRPSLAIIEAIQEGKEPPVAPLEPEVGRPSDDASVRHICDICGGRVFVGKQQWLGHLKSKRHYKKSRKLRLASLGKSHEEKTISTMEKANTHRQEDKKQDIGDG